MYEAAGMFKAHQTIGSVPCCKCGIAILPNATNMCVNCLQSEFDITEGLQKHFTIIHCTKCESYLHPPRNWVKAQRDSKELLDFCIKRLRLKRVGLVHAAFVWTEPHSKRIKLKVEVRKEGATAHQSYTAEYVLMDRLCESCSRIHANADLWAAKVQLRQHVSHRRSFFYLEQLILKHNAALHAIKIRQINDGIDFFFASGCHASKFVDFVGKVVPIQTPRNTKQLLSRDTKSNKYKYRDTFSVEICPICREDLILLPCELSKSLGNFGPTVLCIKVSDDILLMDPFTLRYTSMDAAQYWKAPFGALLSCKQLVEYKVLCTEPIISEASVSSLKFALAEVQVARGSDMSKILRIKTHLGHLLKPGDYALGYDIHESNIDDMELDTHKRISLPDAILVKKSYERERQKAPAKPRYWKLKSLNMEVDSSSRRLDENKINAEYKQFLEDLEENPEMRFNISLYRNKECKTSEPVSVTDGGYVPSVPLEELLADLDISDDDS